MATAKKSAPRTRQQIAPQARALEWGFGVVSGVLVALLLGYLAYQGIRTPAPPDFTLRVERIAKLGSRYHVAVEIRNIGDSTAAEVAVRGVAGGGAAAETSETVLDFMPPRSSRETVLLFDRDPGAGNLTLSVRAYNAP